MGKDFSLVFYKTVVFYWEYMNPEWIYVGVATIVLRNDSHRLTFMQIQSRQKTCYQTLLWHLQRRAASSSQSEAE